MRLRSLFAAPLLIGLALLPGEASATPTAPGSPVAADEEAKSGSTGTVGLFDLQQTTRRSDRPPSDPVGGFQISAKPAIDIGENTVFILQHGICRLLCRCQIFKGGRARCRHGAGTPLL